MHRKVNNSTCSRQAAPTADGARVYLASSLHTFSTPRYDSMLAAAQQHFPDAAIVPARGLYTDSDDWRARWPHEARGYAAGVVFADADGCIGKGTYTEIETLRALLRPVFILDDAGALHILRAVRITLIAGGADWHRYARLQIVRPMPFPEILPRPKRHPQKQRGNTIREGGV